MRFFKQIFNNNSKEKITKYFSYSIIREMCLKIIKEKYLQEFLDEIKVYIEKEDVNDEK
jgi:hypothetical protein